MVAVSSEDDGTNRRCQGTTCHPPSARPWAGTPRADDHDALARLLSETPEGASVIWLARTLFGPGVKSGDKDWKFVRRHGKRHHRVERPTTFIAVQVAPGVSENQETKPDLVWVFPTDPTSYEGVLDTASGISAREGGPTTLANAEGLLARRRTLATAGIWGGLVGAFGGKRLGEERSAGGPERTRFNDMTRALGGRDRVRTAFAGAYAMGHREGAVVTVTTDPARYGSVGEAAADLMGDVNALRRWLVRPPGVTVVEPTEQGVPHAHIALFIPPEDLPSRHELHGYWWECRERGQQVHVAPLTARETAEEPAEAWAWADGRPAGADGCAPVTYLTAGAQALATVADLSAEDVLSVAEVYRERGDTRLDASTASGIDGTVRAEAGAPGGPVRRAAWYWATELSTVTTPSSVLREGASTV